jgi:adenosine deaminase
MRCPAAFIDAMPKAELHLHIEGTLEPELMMKLAARNGVELPFGSVEDIRKAYSFSKLQDFLDIYYQGMAVLRTAEDFYDLTWAYLEKVKAQNVTHVEIFFDPQGHTERGVSFATVMEGITRALDEGVARLSISHRLIMCFLRHLSEAEAFDTLEQAAPYLRRIDGVGLDSSEIGHPPSKFTRVFAKARSLGLRAVAHAGEEGPPEYVREALDQLRIERIDHGNRAMEDLDLVARIAASQMALTVCPLSNLRLCVVEDLKAHPLPEMLAAGLRATVNSDDPSYFGGYVNENYEAVAEARGLSQSDVTTLARNSYLGSFLPDHDKGEALAAFDAFEDEYKTQAG